LEAGKPADHNLAEILKQTFASVDGQLKEHEFLVHHFLSSRFNQLLVMTFLRPGRYGYRCVRLDRGRETVSAGS
jgi:hypothetical protein